MLRSSNNAINAINSRLIVRLNFNIEFNVNKISFLIEKKSKCDSKLILNFLKKILSMSKIVKLRFFLRVAQKIDIFKIKI